MTEKTELFLVIRPKDRWERTRDFLKKDGVDFVFADVLTYIPTHTPLVPLTGIHGVIVTSLRAITSLKDMPSALRELPFFVVGAETAQQLKNLGFNGPQTVASTAEGLIPLINEQPALRQTFLYIRGSDVAVQFRKIIKSHVILEHTSYRGLPKSGLSDDVVALIKSEKLTGILFFSRENTRAFWDMAERFELTPHFSKMFSLCLSPAVLGCLNPEFFKETLTAPTPDLQGMAHILGLCMTPLQKDLPVTQNNFVSVDPDVVTPMIANAEGIIERFGGIRPMAHKLGVPVTTVQGWKKRGLIPATRAALIEQSAQMHGVETTGLIHIISGEVTTRISVPLPPLPKKPEIVLEAVDEVNVEESKEEEGIKDDPVILDRILNDISDMIQKPEPDQDAKSDQIDQRDTNENDDILFFKSKEDEISEMMGAGDAATSTIGQPLKAVDEPGMTLPSIPRIPNRRKIDKIARATWLAVILLATAVIIGLVAMTPGLSLINNQDVRLKTLASDIDRLNRELLALRDQNAVLVNLVPRDLKDRIDVIQVKAKDIENTVVDLGTQTRALTKGVMDGAHSIDGRLSDIEVKVGDISKTFASERLSQFVGALNAIKLKPTGRDDIDRMVRTLYGALPVDVKAVEFQNTLIKTVKSTPELSAMFDGFSNDDIRHGTLILVLTHMRDAVNGDRVAFTPDVQLLEFMLPDQKKILAPFEDISKQGVRSYQGLIADFDTLSDNVKTVLFKEFELTWGQRLGAYIHEKMRIERDGVPLTGTKPQHILDRAHVDLASQRLPAVVSGLQSLEPSFAPFTRDFVKDAEATIAAHQNMDALTKAVSVMLSLDPLTSSLIDVSVDGPKNEGYTYSR